MGQVLHHRPKPTADRCPTGAPSWGRPGFAPSDPTRQLSPSSRVPFHAGDAPRLVAPPEPTPTPACARQDAQSPWFSMLCSAPFNPSADLSGKSIGHLDTLQSDGGSDRRRGERGDGAGRWMTCLLCRRPGSVSQSPCPVSTLPKSAKGAMPTSGGEDDESLGSRSRLVVRARGRRTLYLFDSWPLAGTKTTSKGN